MSCWRLRMSFHVAIRYKKRVIRKSFPATQFDQLVQEGEEVCINYGEQRSNDTLLQFYGFVERPTMILSMWHGPCVIVTDSHSCHVYFFRILPTGLGVDLTHEKGFASGTTSMTPTLWTFSSTWMWPKEKCWRLDMQTVAVAHRRISWLPNLATVHAFFGPDHRWLSHGLVQRKSRWWGELGSNWTLVWSIPPSCLV